MAGYKVLIDDNFHFMDEGERVTHGLFATADEAVATCKRIVDECLEAMLGPGMTAAALYGQYEQFGEDPVVVPVDSDGAQVAFTASVYAKQRCQVLGVKPPVVFPADWQDVTADHDGAVVSIVGVKRTK